MTETTTAPAAIAGIHAAMFAVSSEIPSIAKEGKGPSSQGSYGYLKIDDILEKIKPILTKHQIQVYPQLVEHTTDYHHGGDTFSMDGKPIGDGRVKAVRVREWVLYDFTFVYIPDGSAIVVRTSGEGMDTQDKATRKATTSAWKVALIQTFGIITGEPDPDGQDGGRAAEQAQQAPKQDRGQQMAAAAKAPAKPPVAAQPQAEAETLPEPPAAELDAADTLKSSVRIAVGKLGIGKVEVDAIAAEATGGLTRDKWLNSVPQLKKIVAALEQKVAELPAAPAAAE